MQTQTEGPIYIQYRAKSGDELSFDISQKACEHFGFYHQDRVETPKGAATVVGVREGCMWFHIDGDRGASYWDNGKSYVELLSIGISLLSTPQNFVEPSERTGVYKVKRISYGEKNLNIVLQNENGPCPLISISNVLALRGAIVIDGEGPNQNVVTFQTLQDTLSAYLYDANLDKGEQQLQQVAKSIELLPQLQYGLDVNFNFREIDNFEKTDQCRIFDQLNIRLVHGWLVDPEAKDVYNAIGTNTYNDLMNKLVALDAPASTNTASTTSSQETPSTPSTPSTPTVPSDSSPKKQEEPPKPPTQQDYQEGVIVDNFLKQTASQLTSHGLAVLHNSIKEGDLCVFFRNNHFSTLTKHQGSLYILVTDVGYERERNIVWDLLNSVDGSSTFFTSDFKNSDSSNKEEVVSTLELMGFSKTQIEEGLKDIPKDAFSNVDNVISRAVQIINTKQQPQVV
jgi:hypothetical protein